MKERTVRRVTKEFSPVDCCAPIFGFNNVVWMEGAELEIINDDMENFVEVKSLPNGRLLTAKKDDILTKTEIVEKGEYNENIQ